MTIDLSTFESREIACPKCGLTLDNLSVSRPGKNGIDIEWQIYDFP